MFPKTRREFLRLSASAAAVAALAKSSLLWSGTIGSPGPVKTWVSSDTQKFAPGETLDWTTAVSKDSECIRIDPTTWYQEILGFGGAFTDASCGGVR
jgi:hypothetical protein